MPEAWPLRFARSELADVSQHRSREIVPTKYSRYAISYGQGAPVDLFNSHKQDAHADSRVYAAFTYRMQNEEKWAVNAAGLLGAVCGF